MSAGAVFDSCIYVPGDGWDGFSSENEMTARKEYRCCECQQVIPRGSRYVRISGRCGDSFFKRAMCTTCHNISKSLFPDGHELGTMWDEINFAFCSEGECICHSSVT